MHAISTYSFTFLSQLSSFLAFIPRPFSFFYKCLPLFVNFFPLRFVISLEHLLLPVVGLSRQHVKMDSEGILIGYGVCGEGVVMGILVMGAVVA